MAGWNEWVPGTNMTLSEVLDALKSASVGLDVKDKLYWSFFKVVQEAIKEGNANFDVEMAKGVYNTLKDRLDAGDTHVDDIITDVKSQLGELGAVATFKGSDTNANILAKPNKQVGDEWYDITNKQSLRWNGTAWIAVGGTVSLADGTVTDSKLAPKAVPPRKTTFLGLDTSKNLFDGTYIKAYLAGTAPSYTITGANGNVAEIAVSPNSMYSVSVRGGDNILIKARTATKKMSIGENLDGAMSYEASLSRVIETGPNDRFLYISTNLPDGNAPFLKVVESSFIVDIAEDEEYPIVPQGVSIYSKDQVKDLVAQPKTPEDMTFFIKEPGVNLFDGHFVRGKYLAGNEPFSLVNSPDSLIIIKSIKPNTTYSVIKPDASSESGVYYSKIATSSQTADELIESQTNVVMSGVSRNLDSTSNYSFTSGPSDRSIVVVAKRYEETYVEILEGEYTQPLNVGYDSSYKFAQNIVMPENKTVKASVATNKISVTLGEVKYILEHQVKPFVDGGTYQNQDTWRITNCFVNGKSIVTSGAWECAIEIDGLPDFHGTFHGYEKMTDIFIYSDGKKVTEGNYEGGSLKIIYKGNLIRQTTQNDIIANFVRIYEFEDGKLNLQQKYTWLDSFAIKNAYLTMLPILPNPTSHTVIEDLDYTEYDISDINNVQPTNAQREGITNAHVFGDDASVDINIKYDDPSIKNTFRVWQAQQYNKLYFSYSTGEPVASGDKWGVTTEFDIH